MLYYYIRELENVQRRATKLIQNLTYSERLQNLNLPSLFYCRNYVYGFDYMTYKILNEDVLVDKDYFLQ